MRDRRTFLRRVGGVLGVGCGIGVVGAVGAGVDSVTTDRPSVLVAGSLQGVASDVGDAVVEAHGSVAARRLVVGGVRDPDALALADPVLFDGLAERVTLFATNALVLVYDPASDHADALARDWRAALADTDVRVGRTDPARDPLGYRTVLALELDGELDAERALAGTSVFPETALLRNVEAGSVDAAFAYRNMAVEHGLPSVDLPTSIDLSDPARADHYATATTTVDDRTLRGRPIRYGAAALTERGEAWVDALVSGRERLRAAGFSVPETYPVSTSDPSADARNP